MAQQWGRTIELNRLEQGMSQEALADLVGVSQQTVSKWERDECAPRDGIRALIAQALGVDVHELFTLKVGV